MIWAIVLVVVGTALAVAEVFFVSLGAFAIAAGACILLADMIAFGESPTIGWIFVALELVLIPTAIRFAFRVLPRLPFGRRMLLQGPATPPKAAFPAFDHLVGRAGRALTDLRPSGTAEIGDERLSVVSLSGMLPRGTSLVVDSVEGTEVRVRPAVPEPPVPRSPA